jgi:transcriptional regulator with XRE-family HTH domain
MATPATTYKEFGERVDCDYTTVSRLLSGERAPSTRLLGRICTVFGLDRGEALEQLEIDHQRDDGRTTAFAQYLREHTIRDAVSEQA